MFRHKAPIILVLICTLFSFGCRKGKSLNSIAFSRSNSGNQITVITVHGTYGGASSWGTEVDGKVTFASELRESIGGNTKIVPFLWRTSIQHDARQTAAQELAQLIDSPTLANDRLVIVGHSHGGNVSLLAADRCNRRIDAVICLGTPHIHLATISDGKTKLHLPVYCSPAAKSRIGRIVNIQIQFDLVVNVWSKLRHGITDQQAVAATTEWQMGLNYPRLSDDGGPVVEVIEDLLETKLVSNVAVSSTLAASDIEIRIPCEIGDESAHNAIHSCRMGQILGSVIKCQFSEDSLDFLRSTVVPLEVDCGEPQTKEAWEQWLECSSGKLHDSGLILEEMRLDSVSETNNDKPWDLDGTLPDVFVQVTGSCPDFSTNRFENQISALWKPRVHFNHGTVVLLKVLDRDLVTDQLITQAQARAGQSKISLPGARISMKWSKADY